MKQLTEKLEAQKALTLQYKKKVEELEKSISHASAKKNKEHEEASSRAQAATAHLEKQNSELQSKITSLTRQNSDLEIQLKAAQQALQEAKQEAQETAAQLAAATIKPVDQLSVPPSNIVPDSTPAVIEKQEEKPVIVNNIPEVQQEAPSANVQTPTPAANESPAKVTTSPARNSSKNNIENQKVPSALDFPPLGSPNKRSPKQKKRGGNSN